MVYSYWITWGEFHKGPIKPGCGKTKKGQCSILGLVTGGTATVPKTKGTRNSERQRQKHTHTHRRNMWGGLSDRSCGVWAWTQQPVVALRRENEYPTLAVLFSQCPVLPIGQTQPEPEDTGADWDSSYRLASQSTKESGQKGREDLERQPKGSSIGGPIHQTGN